jgi:hypothetical protein
VKEARDLNAEYQINEMHYRNELEAVTVSGDRTHQAWKGSKVRGRLMVMGKITYHMLVFQKPVREKKATCTSVVTKKVGESGATFTEIAPDRLMKSDELSSSYECNTGSEWYDKLKANQTEARLLGELEKEVFGSYKDVFSSRLNEFYKSLPAKAAGKFVNIESGSAGTKNLNKLAGPLEYWTLSPDEKKGNNTLVCEETNCPVAPDCSFDVSFSHGLLEHTKHPWDALDRIARMTKRGGLTMHVVPFSYPYHSDDNYRFSHSALKLLLEERGFTVLNVGYDVCTKPKSLRQRDDLYDSVWLTYIVARKKS